jgi:hypothetical protein
MFAIRLLPPEIRGTNGERLGEIVIDDFRECFACHLASGVDGEPEASWRAALAALTESESVAVLRHDPQCAWVIYREGDECFVQQRLSLSGTFESLLPRTITTEDGDAVSMWTTSVAAVRQFLDGEPDRLSPRGNS